MRRIGRRWGIALCLCTALWFSWIAPAYAERVKAFNQSVGYWVILGYNDDKPICAAMIKNGTDVFVFDYMTHYSLTIVDEAGRVKLLAGDHDDLTITIDDGSPKPVKAVVKENRIVIPLSGDAGLEPFRKGRWLKVDAARDRFVTSLEESGRALSLLRDCVAQVFGKSEPSASFNPFSSQPSTIEHAPQSEDDPSSSPEGRIVDERNVGAWTLTAAVAGDDEATCMITRTDDQGPILGITAQKPVNQWFFILSFQAWQLERGADYDVEYVIDDANSVRTVARARSETMMVILLGKTPDAIEAFRYGKKLDFRSTDGTIALFDLSGLPPALNALLDCARERLGL